MRGEKQQSARSATSSPAPAHGSAAGSRSSTEQQSAAGPRSGTKEQSHSSARPRRSFLAALLIVFAAGAAALWRVSGRTLYWDDFLIPAIYGDPGALSFTGLFRPHDGHLMPGAIAIQLAVDRLAPLSWWLPAALIVLGTLASALAWAASGIARGRPLVLAMLCFSPFMGVALGWWSAALNSLGWQIACALAVLILRRARPSSPSRQLLVGCGVALAVLLGLLLTEKALSIVPLLTAVAIFFPAFLSPHFQDAATPRTRALTLLPGWLLTAGWAVLYFALNRGAQAPDSAGTAAEQSGQAGDAASVIWGAVPRALAEAIAPGVLGGPWGFERWSPGASFASPSTALSVLAVLGLVAALGFWLWRGVALGQGLRLRLIALGLSVGYLAIVFGSLALARSGVGTADVIASSLHYYADWFAATVLLCTAAATQGEADTQGSSETRGSSRAPGSSAEPGAADTPGHAERLGQPKSPRASRRVRRVAQPVLAVAFIASSALTTGAYLGSWADDHTPEWLRNTKESLRASPAPLLPQPVPATIANRFGPERVDIGDVARSLPDWPGVSAGTPTPQFLLDEGKLVAGDVLKLAENTQPNSKECGQRIPLNKPTHVTLDAPLKFGEWTWVLNTSATAPVTLRILTPNGLESYEDSLARAQRVHVPAELNQQYVRVSGGGDTIEVLATPTAPATPAAGNYVCLGAGEIGPLLPQGE